MKSPMTSNRWSSEINYSSPGLIVVGGEFVFACPSDHVAKDAFVARFRLIQDALQALDELVRTAKEE